MAVYEISARNTEYGLSESKVSAIVLAKENRADVIDADTGEVYFSYSSFSQKVKNLVSREVVPNIQDETTKNIINNIMFADENSIDWSYVYHVVMAFMPELQLYDGYKLEEMEAF